MKNILTVNPGSTSVKYALFDTNATVLAKKEFDRKSSNATGDAERTWLEGLVAEHGVINAISMRIVHSGGVVGPKILDTETKIAIKKATQFAPIHNVIALDCIDVLEDIFPSIQIIANFDTDFHKTIPKHASIYPINAQLSKQLNIKRYGFHGLAVQSVLSQLQKKLKSELPSKVICAHLGGGCSVTAVKDGKSIDTTMGLTPLEGLMMITRSGSIDPGIIEYIADTKGWTVTKVLDMLNNESGFFGMTGSKNTLDIIERASKYQEPEKLAFDIFINRIIKQIFAYYGILQGCDALVFSGGMGYGNVYLQSQILKKIKIINITEENTFVFKANEARVLFDNAKDVLCKDA